MAFVVLHPAGAKAPLDSGAQVTLCAIDNASPTAALSASIASAESSSVVFVNGASATSPLCRVIAEALESAGVEWIGVRPQHLGYNRAQLLMAAYYQDVTVPAHRLLRPKQVDAAGAMSGLAYPVIVRTLDTGDFSGTPCSDAAALDAALQTWGAKAPRCMVEEDVVAATDGSTRVTVVVLGNRQEDCVALCSATVEETTLAAAKKVFKAIYEGVGAACITFVERKGEPPTLLDIVPDLFATSCSISLDVLALASKAAATPTFQVAFQPQMRGYHVSAARSLKKGEVVFHDEQHAFPIVTKPFVEAHWSAEDREVFKRYAWPIDSDQHVYAVWENDPRTWRPINHSCAPNLVFGKNNSLNVIASRDIPSGEDLTVDYATFCDDTMAAFDCFCGATECRKRIFPDAENLAKYGTNAWHRRIPSKPKPSEV